MNWKRRCYFSRSLICFTVCCVLPQAHGMQFHDVTKETGISFIHTDGSSGQRYIVETVTAGVGLFDYDNDGDMDIYFLNGAPLKGTQASSVSRNALYRNDGAWKFTDVTDRVGVGDTGYGLGMAIGDYDNDGDRDLYINNFGPNVLYRNNGEGTFTNVTSTARVANGDQVGAGASFLDIDQDGDLDLYVANYVDFTYATHQTCRFNGYPAYVGPMNFNGTPNTLFRNNGDGTFSDISEASGIAAHPGTGMGMVCADYDNDGDTDVFVGNDVAGNSIFENDGQGNFEEVGLMTGLAYDYTGTPQGTMGVDCGDYNNDGLLDFYVTSYQRDLATLYRNMGDGLFEDVTQTTGAGNGSYPYVTWGNGMVDFDNDGDLDLFVACGHLHDNVALFDRTTSYHVPNILLENKGDEKFVNVTSQSGDGLQVKLSSRGAAFGDLDNDGDMDVVILNSRREPTLLRNDTSPKHHWLQLRLQGRQSSRDGIGAHVKVIAGDLKQFAEVHSGRGYQGHYGLRLHFGLASHPRIDRVEVQWLGGAVDVLENIPVDQRIEIVQGSSPPH
ncbi:MAG: CRTAC1 family protein [Phycisphaeraceae bacterium]|nr:CRTAC1 family protein [Phycisphaeraceae bacterium]